MKEKITNSIAQRQQTINELKKIKASLEDAVPGSMQFVIKSRQFLWTDLYTHKDVINVSYHTLQLVLDNTIEKERERIDKLIDMEIDKRIGGRNGDK